ncbi:M20/M25/M40 family metallo-hydrolase [uncultured Mucilaginibacter sp.]|uniref:M20/M25/M40 family metallo-hydrolase n=1 Tax=uncultured Mucilaginibacter sp. TaxID=797541 RepID=UPI00262B6BF0|nr:M20/M25/M40 family metallo-hydrolase [uncultured Mucilaginibacter sp.]
MKFKFLLSFLLGSTLAASAQNPDSVYLRKIFDEELVNGQPYQNLQYLCKQIGPRLSGSANAQKAVDWTKKLMQQYGFDRVFLQEVMVPHWVRGEKEQAKIVSGNQQVSVSVVALGGSVATPKEGLKAEVIEVQGIQELKTLGEKAIKGKIVFYNRPFDPRFIETGAAYGAASDQRFRGPAEAAKYGAIGVIVRSMTEMIDDYPHTGATAYEEGGNKIPAAAISTKGANLLSLMLKQQKGLQFYLKQNCQTLPDVLSYNVVGEMKGTENPNEFITVGGHLDSWDLAEGAHDDGTGVMQSVEVLRIFKALGYRPKHSIRAVLFMNEENGHKGGLKYAELAQKNNEKHLAAIETDEGGFTPRGFSFSGIQSNVLQGMIKNWKPLLEPYEVERLTKGGAGTDIEPLKETRPSITLIGFRPDSQRYFDIHHTAKDVFENVNKRELELGAASIAALIYLIDQHGLTF